VAEIARRDPKAAVRLQAVNLLQAYAPAGNAEALAVLRNAAQNDSSYAVTASALGGLHALESTRAEALALARKMTALDSDEIRYTVSGILLEENDPTANSYIRQIFPRMGNGIEKLYLLQQYGSYLGNLEETETRNQGLTFLQSVAEFNPVWYVRFGAARALLPFAAKDATLMTFLKRLKAQETNGQLQEIYSQMIPE
jgi:hypothetical protein